MVRRREEPVSVYPCRQGMFHDARAHLLATGPPVAWQSCNRIVAQSECECTVVAPAYTPKAGEPDKRN